MVEVLITVPLADELLDRLREISPSLRISVIPAKRVDDIPPEIWARIEVLYTDRVIPEPSQVGRLRWIQFHYAGIDFALDAPLLKKADLSVTTLSGAAASQTAEFAVGMLLAFSRHFPELLAHQNRCEWPRDRLERFAPRELRGSTVALVGYGSIARELARILHAFGAVCLAVKKDVFHPQDEGYMREGLGDPGGDYLTRLYPIQALRSMLKECDFVVVSLPLTSETRGLIGRAELAALKRGAYLVDIGRGGIVDLDALGEALENGQLSGAALDVFLEEPLPPGSPVWRFPNVIVTPHIAGISTQYKERAMAVFSENLRRYVAGHPLLNRYDPRRGY